MSERASDANDVRRLAMAGMNTLIVSPKKEGNTYEVASYLKANSDAKLYTIDGGFAPDLEEYEHIVLCSGVYGDKIHNSLLKWISSLDKEIVKDSAEFHLFLTWFGRGKSDYHAMQQVAKALQEKELKFDENYGTCLGGKSIIRSGHPNGGDFVKALEWMREQVKI